MEKSRGGGGSEVGETCKLKAIIYVRRSWSHLVFGENSQSYRCGVLTENARLGMDFIKNLPRGVLKKIKK